MLDYVLFNGLSFIKYLTLGSYEESFVCVQVNNSR